MLVLGILLLLLAAGLFVAFLSTGSQQVTFDGGVLDITMSTLVIYLLGALTLLLLVAGLSLVRGGVRRAGQRRKEHKELNRLSAKLEQHEAEKRADTEPSADDHDAGAPAEGSTATAPVASSDETATRAAPQPSTAPATQPSTTADQPTTASGTKVDETGTSRA